MKINCDLTADLIDVRDIIGRIEDLESEIESESGKDPGDFGSIDKWLASIEQTDSVRELIVLNNLMEDLKGISGDEKWRGNWYRVTLIRDSYFKTYAQELAHDIGAIDENAGWPNSCIDWDMAARELQYDYSPIHINDTTYWTR